MKKIKINTLLIVMLALISLFSVKTFAMSPPYLSLATSQDVITKNNAVLHATLNNMEGITVSGFEIFVYKDNVLVKSGLKKVNSQDKKIDIVFDLNKDLSVQLKANTTYTYTIYARTDSEVNTDMYKQSFHFTTLDENSDAPKETTGSTEITTLSENSSAVVITKKTVKPAVVRITQAKNIKKKSIVIKFRKTKNAKKYQIQYSRNMKFKKATIRNTKKRIYIIKKLKKGKTYYIRVRGINGKKKGNWSRIKRVTIKK